VASGLAGGVVRQKKDVGAFALTLFPVTRGEYAKCVKEAACRPPEAGCVERLKSAHASSESPEVCVHSADAAAFCKWVGGELPTLEQWFLAARGTAPKRFAWGDALPVCEQHGLAYRYYADHTGKPISPDMPKCEVRHPDAVKVGEHPDGASGSGLQDVLLTQAELLRGTVDGTFPACTGAQRCVVYGLMPGSIDAVAAVPTSEAPDPGITDRIAPTRDFGFRCAFTGK
jgi:hypothetical protein